jgi:hypothetical protein
MVASRPGIVWEAAFPWSVQSDEVKGTELVESSSQSWHTVSRVLWFSIANFYLRNNCGGVASHQK